MNEPDKIRILHPDGTIHVAKTVVYRASNGSLPWMAISRCGVKFEFDENVEPELTKNMVKGIITNNNATCEACEACQATP